MADVKLFIPDELAAEWKRKSGMNPAEFAIDAFTFYVWAVNETSHNRIILSANPDGNEVVQLDAPSLRNVVPHNVIILRPR